MAIITKKLTDSTLKRITKTDNTYEDVRITDVPSNVIEEGTNITDSVLSNINYKNDNNVTFDITDTDVIPDSNKATIYGKSDGSFYFRVNGQSPIVIGGNNIPNYQNLMNKSGDNYTTNGEMKYFNLDNELKFFSTRTKIGGIESRNVESSDITNATYFEINQNEIKGNIAGVEKLLLNGSRFEIKGKDTTIGINNGLDKLRLDTNLSNATYGNSNFGLNFGNSIEIKNKNNNQTLSTITNTGEISLNKLDIETPISNINESSNQLNISSNQANLKISNNYFSIELTNSNLKINDSNNNAILTITPNGELYLGNKNVNENLNNITLGLHRHYLDVNNKKIDCDLTTDKLYKVDVIDGNYTYELRVKSDEVNTKHIVLYGDTYVMLQFYEGDPDEEEDYSYFYVKKYSDSNPSGTLLVIDDFIEYSLGD